jgi:hypothetical protein
MLSNLYLINGASKYKASFTIMNVQLFVYIYILTISLFYFILASVDIVHNTKRGLLRVLPVVFS